ncbi:VOC family protein [Litoreibacter roseus]|uniref:Glyoxalase n=1 Tax=Litoreibacter roseus TaxID=2601869 RepID=A0A6N6JP95_9RHOB|nr:VOC family protein [Litoreibacter roseus]GFE67302.1 glyoxalase [Litoreibacter roseus]
MPLVKIFAQLSCTDMERSTLWFTRLFGRSPDTNPMAGLNEWHHTDNAGFQLVENEHDARHGCMTLTVDDITSELRRLHAVGIETGETSTGDIATIAQMRDPDGNVIVLAEPSK